MLESAWEEGSEFMMGDCCNPESCGLGGHCIFVNFFIKKLVFKNTDFIVDNYLSIDLFVKIDFVRTIERSNYSNADDEIH